jgi:hypothetical protein
LERNNTKSINSCGELAISPSHSLGLTIRWCSGSSFHDIRDAGNFSLEGNYSIVHCTRHQMVLPRTANKLEDVKKGFESKSTENVMSGCVVALDGILLLIRMPSRREASNVRQFFSGHYQWMGLNVQAVLVSKLRFMFAAI